MCTALYASIITGWHSQLYVISSQRIGERPAEHSVLFRPYRRFFRVYSSEVGAFKSSASCRVVVVTRFTETSRNDVRMNKTEI
ncbi:hypothetical protein Tco_0644042 [Tanacetum coccineum]